MARRQRLGQYRRLKNWYKEVSEVMRGYLPCNQNVKYQLFLFNRTLPSKLGIELIAQKLKEHKIQGLIIIGGFEVRF